MRVISIHKFQYNLRSFDWVPERKDLARIEHTLGMFERTTIGNDV